MSTDPTPGTRLGTNEHTLPGEPDTIRRALRRAGIERRLALGDVQYKSFSATICQLIDTHFPELASRRVGFCWPIRNEPDLRHLIGAWAARGEDRFAALLPVVTGAAAPLAFRRWLPDAPMVLDRYGIPMPETGEFETPEVLLIPVNAFDANGYRIGYGGGFFDRTMAALGATIVSIGVGFELARVDSTYPQPHDIPLDTIVTELGVFPTHRAAG